MQIQTNNTMIDLLSIGKRILKQQKLNGPPIKNPEFETTDFGCKLQAGNLTLHLYTDQKQFATDSIKAQRENPKYLTQGTYQSNIVWYLTN